MIRSTHRKDPKSLRSISWLGPSLICLAVAPLFLVGLGDAVLWTDEAQTAGLARSVLRHGVPMTGTGPDSVTAHCGEEAGLGGLHLQMPWLQAYLAAASIAALGLTSFAARLPFALFGWACVPLAGWVTGLAGGRRFDRYAAMLLTGTSVYFLLHARQARYYAPAAFFVLLAVGAYLDRSRSGGATRAWLLPAAVTGLVLTFDVSALGVLAGLGMLTLWEAWRQGDQSLRQWWERASFLVVPSLVLVGWIALASTAPSRRSPGAFADPVLKLLYYAAQMNAHVAPLLVVVPMAILLLLRRRDERDRLRGLASILTIIALGLLAAMAPPLTFPRYFIAFVPLVLVGVALLVGVLPSTHRRFGLPAAAAVVLLLIAGTPHKISHDVVRSTAGLVGFGQRVWHPVESWSPLLLELVAELRDPPTGPVSAVIEHVNTHGTPGERILVSYAMPALRYHTGLVTYGGLTCEFPPAGSAPEWIWLRPGWRLGEAALVQDWVDEQIDLSQYERIELPVPDRQWENREDIHQHVFRDPGPKAPPVVLYRLRRTPDG